jgi:hypothetical protein
MKNHRQPRQPKKAAPDARQRWEREKVEDERRYQHYLKTGDCISHEEMVAWFDQLEREAESKL